MYSKCLHFLIILISSFVNVDLYLDRTSMSARSPWSLQSCPTPYIENGRFRKRLRIKRVKFMCYMNYELVGNTYATCRNGQWDSPFPVCVRPGCTVPVVNNSIILPLHRSAWIVHFCLPGYKLVGSAAIYCNGRNWNATAPQCIDEKAPKPLSCDFEDPYICGWTHDELHDFDWMRHNRKTPTSILQTGPSYDHTYGPGGSGYYMYIESTSRLENDTARLLSPIFDSALAKDGCFSFYYHMFGVTTGGLRVYQKPDSVSLPSLVSLSQAERKLYMLFELWGNQGDKWYHEVPKLKDFGDDFQIVLEGIRGTSYTSDIAIDDVAILQGDNCIVQTSTTSHIIVMPDSCQGRCYVDLVSKVSQLACGCSIACVANSDCCPDFFDVCIFNDTWSATDETTPIELPQTQKLVSVITETITTTELSTTTAKTTTKTTPTTVPTTIITQSTTKLATPIPTTKLTTKLTTKPTTKLTTKAVPIVTETTTSRPRKAVTTSTVKTTPAVLTTKFSTAKLTTKQPAKTTTVHVINDDVAKEKREYGIQTTTHKSVTQQKASSSTSIIVTIAVIFCVGGIALCLLLRGEKGRQALARMRGRIQNDPEVRYLSADVDDDC